MAALLYAWATGSSDARPPIRAKTIGYWALVVLASIVSLVCEVRAEDAKSAPSAQENGSDISSALSSASIQPFRLEFSPAPQGDIAPVITSLAVSSDGELLAAAGDDHQVHLWHLPSGKYLRRLSGHRDWVRSLVFITDSHLLASGGDDALVLLWSADAGEEIARWRHDSESVQTLGYSSQEKKLLAAGFGGALWVIDIEKRKPVARLDSPCEDIRAMALSPEGSSVAVGGRNGLVAVYNIISGVKTLEFKGASRRIRGLAYADSGELLVASDASPISVFDALGKPLQPFVGPGDRVFAIKMLKPGLVASAGAGDVVRIWDFAKRQQVVDLQGHTGTVAALAYDAHLDALISSGFDASVRLWRLSTAPSAATAQAEGPLRE